MKRTAAGVVMLIAFGGAGAALRPAISFAAPVAATKGPPLLEKRVAMPPPDVVERLRKVGLDAKDPGFSSKLKTLAAQGGPVYVRSHVLSNTPTALRKPVVRSPFPNTGATSTYRNRVREAKILAPLKGTLYYQAWDAGHNAVDLNATAVSSPLGYAFLVVTDKPVAISGQGSVSVALGCAGVTLTESAIVVAGDDPSFKGTAWEWPSAGPIHPYYVWPAYFPPFPIGQERWGTITASFDNVTASATGAFLPTQGTVTIDVTVDHSPAAIGFGSVSPWGPTGLTASNATLKDPGTPRVGSGDWTATTQGNDTVGDGVQVGPGWKVTAVAVKNALSASAPQDTSPDNSWRGAKVTLQPQAGTLRTGVAWHYSGVDTLDYTVEWTLTGPLGRRPLLTMAKHDSCED